MSMNTHVQIPHSTLFACADRVIVPQVGDDDRNCKTSHIIQSITHPFLQPIEQYKKKYIKKISGDLLFSEEVIQCHAAHTLPYDKDSIWKSFDSSNIVHKKSVNKSRSRGRYTQKRHQLCSINTVPHNRLKPLKRKSKHPKEIHYETTKVFEKRNEDTSQNIKFSQSDLTVDTQDDINNKLDKKISTKWDEHLLMNLSKDTATWIVSEKIIEGPQQDKLNRLLIEIYGDSLHPVDTLIRDDASISDLGEGRDLASQLSRQKAINPAVSLDSSLELENDTEDQEKLNCQPLASFYRHPGCVQRSQKNIDLPGAVNMTARNILIPPKKANPPPTPKDMLNSRVGSKVFETDNLYEQEWLSGAQLMPRKDSSIITFKTDNKYQIMKQENYPADPRHWHAEGEDSKNQKKTMKEKLPHKGYRKWKDLPQPVENDVSLLIHEAGYDSEAHREPDPLTMKQHKSNVVLIRIIDEWRNKWHLGNKWYDSSIDDLEQDMSDINEHVRLQAIATIARGATYRPDMDAGIPLKSTLKKGGDAEGMLPGKLYRCVIKALNDSSMRVRVTAAMALYTLNRPNEEAKQTLHHVIRVGSPPERWAAAQCLSHVGVCDSYVVGELVQQFFNSTEPLKHEQCVNLMSKLSENSMLVHSMIAEQLNSTNWKHRMMACKVLPKLHGHVNKDIIHKLATLMWNDWHHEVRRVAAQTLGKTGHGKEVHNDLHDRILMGTERDKADAIYKIAHLGIMTARLLPAYLKCFDDQYISVRLAATKTAGVLLIEDERVLRKLLLLTRFDNNWKVKAHAIKALAMIGKVTAPISEAIIWALRFETEPGVRAEACSAIITLHISGDDISYILQDKLLVEPDQLVRSQLVLALESMGVSSQVDMDMVLQIKKEVHSLCTRYNIAAKIAQNEKNQENNLYVQKYFNTPVSPKNTNDNNDDDVDTRIASVRTSTGASGKAIPTRVSSISINFDDEHKSDSIAPSLLKGKEISEMSSSPVSKASLATSHAITPEEKLEKLIDLYEGRCTPFEYDEFAHSKGTNKSEEHEGTLSEVTENSNSVTEVGKKTNEDNNSSEDFNRTSNATIEKYLTDDQFDAEWAFLSRSITNGSLCTPADRSSRASSVESVEDFEEAIQAITSAQKFENGKDDATIKSEQSSKHGSEQSSKRGSEKSSKRGSEQSSKHGSEQSSERGNEQSSKHGSEQSSKRGSEQFSKRGSEQSSKRGSEQSSKHGSEQSSKRGSEQSSKRGSEQSSKRGSEQSSKRGSEQSSKRLNENEPPFNYISENDQSLNQSKNSEQSSTTHSSIENLESSHD